MEGEVKVLRGRREKGEEVINGSGEVEEQYKPVFPMVICIWAPGLEAPPLATFISPLSWTVFNELWLSGTRVQHCTKSYNTTELNANVQNCTSPYIIIHHCTEVYSCM